MKKPNRTENDSKPNNKTITPQCLHNKTWVFIGHSHMRYMYVQLLLLLGVHGAENYKVRRSNSRGASRWHWRDPIFDVRHCRTKTRLIYIGMGVVTPTLPDWILNISSTVEEAVVAFSLSRPLSLSHTQYPSPTICAVEEALPAKRDRLLDLNTRDLRSRATT